MITQLFSSKKKGRLSNQKWNAGDLLLKRPRIAALGISVFLLVVEFSLVGSEEVLDPRKSFMRFISWMQTLVWWERIGAVIKHLELEKARKLYNTPFMMQEADTGWYRRGCHGFYLFLFSWVTHKDDVVSPSRKWASRVLKFILWGLISGRDGSECWWLQLEYPSRVFEPLGW